MGCHHLCQWPPLADPRSMLVAVPLPLASGDADVPRYGPPRRQRWTLQRQRQWERKSSLDLPQELSKSVKKYVSKGQHHATPQYLWMRSNASIWPALSCKCVLFPFLFNVSSCDFDEFFNVSDSLPCWAGWAKGVVTACVFRLRLGATKATAMLWGRDLQRDVRKVRKAAVMSLKCPSRLGKVEFPWISSTARCVGRCCLCKCQKGLVWKS